MQLFSLLEVLHDGKHGDDAERVVSLFHGFATLTHIALISNVHERSGAYPARPARSGRYRTWLDAAPSH